MIRYSLFAALILVGFAVLLRFFLLWIEYVGTATGYTMAFDSMRYLALAGFVFVALLVAIGSWQEASDPKWLDRILTIGAFASAMAIVFKPA